MARKTVRGDRLVLALISVLRTLVLELSRRGVMNADEFVYIVQQTAIAHRESGDPNQLADAIHLIIPTCADQNPLAQSRRPMDMMVQGRSMSLFQATQQWSTRSV